MTGGDAAAYAQPAPGRLYVHDDLTALARERLGAGAPGVALAERLIARLRADPAHVTVLTLEEQLAGVAAQGPHAPFDHQLLEGAQVLQLLGIHMLDRLRLRLAAQDRELAFIDALGAELAGMVDADDALDQLVLGQVAGPPVRCSVTVAHALLLIAPRKVKIASASA